MIRSHPWHDLETGPAPPTRLNAFIEIPRGSRNKYELDKATGLLRFDRLLYSAVHYPGDYGLIPRTLAEDEDPLDVLVMVTEPTFPGCVIEVRPLGVFRMRDEKGADEKILAVPQRDPLWADVHDLDEVAHHFLMEVRHFFSVYKDLEGIRTEVDGWSNAEAALAAIEAAMARYAAGPGRPYGRSSSSG